jgi:small-conductance mechanosensitive channel/CRP-like cAMP-binding protein
MNWFILTRALLLLFTVALYLFVKRKKLFADFHAVLPHIFLLLFLGLTLSILMNEFVIRIFYSEVLIFIVLLAIFLVLLVLAVKITAFFIFDFLVGKKQNIKYPRLIKDIVVIILYIIGFLLITKYYLNIQITVVLASSAVLTVVFGFALQDILGDLFSGIALNLEESLSLGDWVQAGDVEGKIEQFRWRSIKIRTIDNILVLIPNQVAAKEEVQRFGHNGEPFALRMQIGVSYQNTPDKVIYTIQDVLNEIPEILSKPIPKILVKSFDDFSILYEIRFWLRDYSVQDPVKCEIRRKAWYAFKRENIQIPFPVRDIYIHRPKKEAGLQLTDEEIVAILGKNDILSTLSEKQLASLTDDVEIKRFGKGELLIKENEVGRYFYHILAGSAEVLKDGQVVSQLKEDDYVGEISLFTGDKTVADVRLTCESQVLRISSQKFRETVKLNVKMARKLSEVIAQRKTQLMEMARKEDLLNTSAIKKETESIFLRIKKYFSI